MRDLQKIYTNASFLTQCKDCKYWHDDIEDEHGNIWVPFCDLFHGNGIPIPCDEKKLRNDSSMDTKIEEVT